MSGLESAAFRWLHFEKKCPFMLWERSPRAWSNGEPDMLGITKAGYLYEVEIKRTYSDFLANQRKRHIRFRDQWPDRQVKKYWFMAHSELAERMLENIPEWAGLLSLDENSFRTCELKVAPANEMSKRLSVKECVHAATLMANQMYKLIPFCDGRPKGGV